MKDLWPATWRRTRLSHWADPIANERELSKILAAIVSRQTSPKIRSQLFSEANIRLAARQKCICPGGCGEPLDLGRFKPGFRMIDDAELGLCVTCSKCKVGREITIDGLSGSLKLKPMNFEPRLSGEFEVVLAGCKRYGDEAVMECISRSHHHVRSQHFTLSALETATGSIIYTERAIKATVTLALRFPPERLDFVYLCEHSDRVLHIPTLMANPTNGTRGHSSSSASRRGKSTPDPSRIWLGYLPRTFDC